MSVERCIGVEFLDTNKDTKSMLKSKPNCVVHGALALTLRASRLAGVAPLRMERDGDYWRISVSTPLTVYSYLLMLLLNTGIIGSIIIKYFVDFDTSGPLINSALAIIQQCILVCMITIAVVKSPARMTSIIVHLNKIKKIQSRIRNGTSKGQNLNRRTFLARIFLVAAVLQNIVELSHVYIYYGFITLPPLLRTINMILFMFYYIEIVIAIVLGMQFVHLALHIKSTLRSINESLTGLIIALDKEAAQTTKKAPQTLRDLAHAFGKLCDVIREVDSCFGTLLFLMISSFCVHLLERPYYLVLLLLRPGLDLIRVILIVIYCAFHSAYLITVVEPGHRTVDELYHTQELVGQLYRRVSSPRDLIVTELNYFYKQIILNKISYSPMGLCTLTRPLVTIIFGGVTTYLIILLQFQTLDKK